MIRTLLTSFSSTTLAFALAAAPAAAQDDPDDPNDDDLDEIEEPTIPSDDPDQPVDQTPEPVAEPGDVTGTTLYSPSVTVDPTDPVVEARQPVVATPMGISLSLGAGVGGFRDAGFRDLADTGVAWDLRLAIGTRLPLALEVAYIGGAQDLHALGLDEDALLMSHGAEAGLRVNFANLTRFAQLGVQPYVAGGVAIRRYSVINESFNTSSVADGDTVYEFPIGLGVGLRAKQVMIDLRGSYRFSFDEQLIDSDVGRAEAASSMDSWNAMITAGVEL